MRLRDVHEDPNSMQNEHMWAEYSMRYPNNEQLIRATPPHRQEDQYAMSSRHVDISY